METLLLYGPFQVLLNSLLLKNCLVLMGCLGWVHVSSESEKSSDSVLKRQYRRTWKNRFLL